MANVIKLIKLLLVVGVCQGQITPDGSQEKTIHDTTSQVLPTSTPCIAPRTFLEELRQMLNTEQETSVPGIAGGTHFTHEAGPVNILCLPDNPEYGNYTPGFQADGTINGTEYRTNGHSIISKNLKLHDVPCSVCRSRNKISVTMVPAKMSCFPGWHVEYTGYLMGGHYNVAASEYLCVDGDAEKDRSGHENKDGQRLYLVEGVCGSLPCPPYKNHWEMRCTVCTK